MTGDGRCVSWTTLLFRSARPGPGSAPLGTRGPPPTSSAGRPCGPTGFEKIFVVRCRRARSPFDVRATDHQPTPEGPPQMPRFMGFVKMEEGIGAPPQALFDAMDRYIGEQAA